jgi:hypothetical protein
MIIFSELASIDISRLTGSKRITDIKGQAAEAIKLPASIVWSYVVSIGIVVILIIELNTIFKLLEKNRQKFRRFMKKKIEEHQSIENDIEFEISLKELEELKESNFNRYETLLIEKYTDGIDCFLLLDKNCSFFVIENIRFIFIQILIVALQGLPIF